MTVLDKIQQQFAHHTESHFAAAELLPRAIEHASEVISQVLLAGHKIMTCGNAGAGLLAQYFASGMLNRFDKERPSLPALALTTDSAAISSIACLYDYDQIFSKQLRAFGVEGDLLLLIATQQASNLKQAIEAAQDRQMRLICLVGQNDADLITTLQSDDVAIIIPAESSSHILEIQLQIIHALFAAVDYLLFGILD